MNNAALSTMINSVLTVGQYAGTTFAFYLTTSDEGLEALAADNFALAREISAENLNNLMNLSLQQNVSLALMLASTEKGRAILAAHDHELLRKINSATLNAIVGNSAVNNFNTYVAGASVAFWLACWSPELLVRLLQEPDREIEDATLNHLLNTDPYRGVSVAFWLAFSPAGRYILAANNNALARHINAQTLNALRTGSSANYLNESVAYWLAAWPDGREILTANNNEILLNIDEETMNVMMINPAYQGFSAAFWLTYSITSLQAWWANDQNDPDAGNEIYVETLNHVISVSTYKGTSLAYMLATTAEGRAMLTTQALGNLIDAIALNSIIPVGGLADHVGKSTAFWLSAYPEGRTKLAASQALRALITKQTLNYYVKDDNGKLVGSVGTNLMKTDDGRKILAADDYALLKKMDYRILEQAPYMDLIFAILDGYQFTHNCAAEACTIKCPFAILKSDFTQIDAILNRATNPGYTYALLNMLWNNSADKPFLRSIYESAMVKLLENQFAKKKPHFQMHVVMSARLPQLIERILTENQLISLNTIKIIVSGMARGQKFQKDNVSEKLEFILHTLNARSGDAGMERLYAQFYYHSDNSKLQELEALTQVLDCGAMCYGYNAAVTMHAMLDELSAGEEDNANDEKAAQDSAAKRLKAS